MGGQPTARRGGRAARTARATRAAVAAGLVVLGALVGAPAATAAGPPTLVLPPKVPGGFTTVVAVVRATKKGQVIAGSSGGVAGRLVVPPGSLPGRTDVLVTAGAVHGIPASALAVPAKQRHLRPVYAVGILFQRGTHRVRNKKLVTLGLRSKRFTRADYVVIYYARRHAFVPAPKNHARCTAGECLVKFRWGTLVAVLGP